MLFFKRILKFKKDTVDPSEMRLTKRYSLGAKFPLKARIALVVRDDVNKMQVASGKLGMDWGGQIVDLSTQGARIRLHPAAEAAREEPCRLKLELKGQTIEIDGVVKHFYAGKQYATCGVLLRFQDPIIKKSYLQLFEPIAVGAGLEPVDPDLVNQDVQGLVKEQYKSYSESLLNLWRDAAGKTIAHFELQIQDYLVRGSAQHPAIAIVYRDCVKVGDRFSYLSDPVPVGPVTQGEVRQLFEWIVLNLGKGVPADARAFLSRFLA